MKFALTLGLICSFAARAVAADAPPPAPGEKVLLVSDDFNRAEVGSNWDLVWPKVTLVDGAMLASQVVPGHGAVARVKAPLKDGIIEFRFRLGGSKAITAVCDDRGWKDSHGGHICRVSLTANQIRLGDDKEAFSKKIEAMRRDPAQKAEAARLTAGWTASIPAKFLPEEWHAVHIEITGDELKVSVDGKPVGQLKSSGIAHPTKKEFHFTFTGGGAQVDDVKIWRVTPPS